MSAERESSDEDQVSSVEELSSNEEMTDCSASEDEDVPKIVRKKRRIESGQIHDQSSSSNMTKFIDTAKHNKNILKKRNIRHFIRKIHQKHQKVQLIQRKIQCVYSNIRTSQRSMKEHHHLRCRASKEP